MQKWRRWGRAVAARVGQMNAPPAGTDVRRMVAIVQGGIGDRLMTLPALRVLRQRYPTAFFCVAWCGKPLPVCDEFDAVCEVSKNNPYTQWRLLCRDWDLLFVNSIGLHSLATEWASALSGIPVRIGPRWPGTTKSVYTQPYEVGPATHVTTANLLGLEHPVGGTLMPYRVDGPEPGKDRRELPILLHVGGRVAYAGYEQNRWPLERFEALARWLVDKLKREVCVLLGPDESDRIRRQVASWPVRIETPPSLDALFAVIRGSALLVGNDSGPAHIAAAVGTPEVILFGPSNPHRSAPVSEKALLLCAGHRRAVHYAELPDHAPLPIDRITVEDVTAAVLECCRP